MITDISELGPVYTYLYGVRFIYHWIYYRNQRIDSCGVIPLEEGGKCGGCGKKLSPNLKLALKLRSFRK